MITSKNLFLSVLCGSILFLAVILLVPVVKAEVNFSEQTQTQNYQNFNFFVATTTTATSTNLAGGGGWLKIAGAKKVTVYFTHGGTATTSTKGAKFSLQTTREGTTWANFNKLIGTDVSSTATSTYTIQGATSTVPVAMDLSDDTFLGVRCISKELASPLGTDGEQTCTASVEF